MKRVYSWIGIFASLCLAVLLSTSIHGQADADPNGKAKQQSRANLNLFTIPRDE